MVDPPGLVFYGKSSQAPRCSEHRAHYRMSGSQATLSLFLIVYGQTFTPVAAGVNVSDHTGGTGSANGSRPPRPCPALLD